MLTYNFSAYMFKVPSAYRLIPSDRPYGSFYLFLSYLLVNPLVPSVYPFVTILLLLSYHQRGNQNQMGN
jgi:hypothetical protein